MCIRTESGLLVGSRKFKFFALRFVARNGGTRLHTNCMFKSFAKLRLVAHKTHLYRDLDTLLQNLIEKIAFYLEIKAVLIALIS